MSEFNKLGLGGVDPTVNPTFQNDLGNLLLERLAEQKSNTNVPFNTGTFDDAVTLTNTRPRGVTSLDDEFKSLVTPFQKDVIEDTEDQADDPFLQGAMVDALTTPTKGS